MFQGDVFDHSDRHKRLKSVLIDMFKMQDVAKVVIEALQRVLVFTCADENDPIDMRHLECVTVSEHLAKRNAVPFNEVGPSCKMRLRREKMAGVDLYKDACRKPKITNVDKKKEKKNKSTDVLGRTMGKVFVQNQDIKTIKLKKYGRKNTPAGVPEGGLPETVDPTGTDAM